jgi:putative transposase
MKAEDVKSTMDKALLTMALPKNRPPKLLSDNGSCCISNELAEYLEEKKLFM